MLLYERYHAIYYKTRIMSSPIQVTDFSFEKEVVNSEKLVLVDFWAPWCGPCRMISPVIDELAQEYSEQVKIVKINTDENPSISAEYGIRSIPTLMLFKNGKRVDTVIGAVPKSTLTNALKKYL